MHLWPLSYFFAVCQRCVPLPEVGRRMCPVGAKIYLPLDRTTGRDLRRSDHHVNGHDPYNWLERLGKTTTNLSKCSHSPGPNSNWEFLGYEPRSLSPRHSARFYVEWTRCTKSRLKWSDVHTRRHENCIIRVYRLNFYVWGRGRTDRLTPVDCFISICWNQVSDCGKRSVGGCGGIRRGALFVLWNGNSRLYSLATEYSTNK
jgi:hypothetical protein